ncbi:hypothetical protein G6F37_001724 [Rhizopus arrhizus]|nr:hypothetical protein G6F38_000787 [Rhizopus arrhizus]KAG1162886.1 hypothetical protein G6F37_001724 [Rhizopus arrhizus]
MSTHESPQQLTTEDTITPTHYEEMEDNSNTEISDDNIKKLKRKLKEIQELNAAIHKDYSHAKKKIRTLTYERNISRMESMSQILSDDESGSDIYSDLSDTDEELDVATSSNKSKILKKLAHRSIETSHDSATVISAPPKRTKATIIPVKTRRVQPIDRDEEGNPKLPQQIGVLTVLSLGRIISDRPTFHNERYIFPVGYTVSRTYPSMADPTSNTVITSTIVDGGDAPRFVVTAADMPDEPIIANSATGAWTVVVRRSNEIRQREHSNSASGPDYYGFKHPTIAKLIQDLPGAKDLKNYVWQNFEEMEPRAAKGVMAAAEKKRGNLEQMGNANRRAPKEVAMMMSADVTPTDEDFGEADELLKIEEYLFDEKYISPQVQSELYEGYRLCPLRSMDYHRDYLKVLSVLTEVGHHTIETWNTQFQYMKKHNNTLTITDEEHDCIAATGTILIEHKFVHKNGIVGHIEDIAVDSSYQGKKLGFRIIEALKYIAQQAGCYKGFNLTLPCSPLIFFV